MTAPPLTDAVAAVREAAAGVFRLPTGEVPVDRSLYELGLDSLRAIELGQALADRFQIEPLSAFSRDATVAGLAQVVLQLSSIAARPPSLFDAELVAAHGARSGRDFVLHPQNPAPELPLAVDDFVPTPILLVGAYPYRIEPTELAAGLQQALNAFPHLAGRLVEDGDGGARIVTSADGVRLEVRENGADERWETWTTEPVESLRERFAPHAARTAADSPDETAPLFAARLTHVPHRDGSVLCFHISHRVLDGLGVALFLNHGAAARRGSVGPPVVHDRSVLRQSVNGERPTLPPWYHLMDDADASQTAEWKLAAKYRVETFIVSDKFLQDRIGAADRGLSWLTLAALLIQQINRQRVVAGEPCFTEAALWCDVRGALGIPTTYTGNVGCYWHVPIFPDPHITVSNVEGIAELVERLREPSTPVGKRRVAETYHALKQAEAARRRVAWSGREPHVLPVNLVPFSPEILDFGRGGPVAVRMLTRNLHGLRITRTGQDDGYVVESCLPGATNNYFSRLDQLGVARR